MALNQPSRSAFKLANKLAIKMLIKFSQFRLELEVESMLLIAIIDQVTQHRCSGIQPANKYIGSHYVDRDILHFRPQLEVGCDMLLITINDQVITIVEAKLDNGICTPQVLRKTLFFGLMAPSCSHSPPMVLSSHVWLCLTLNHASWTICVKATSPGQWHSSAVAEALAKGHHCKLNTEKKPQLYDKNKMVNSSNGPAAKLLAWSSDSILFKFTEN